MARLNTAPAASRDGLEPYGLERLHSWITTTHPVVVRLAMTASEPVLVSASGSVAERFAVGLVAEALVRGDSVLVVSATTVSADQLLDHFADTEGRVLRAVGPLETRVAGLTTHAAGEGRYQEAREKLTTARANTQAQLELWAETPTSWQQLREATERLTVLQALQANIEERRAKLPETIPAQLRAAEAEARSAHSVTTAALTAAIEDATAKKADADERLAEARNLMAKSEELVTAKQAGRLFSRAFWSAVVVGDPGTRLTELRQQCEHLEAEQQKRDEELKKLRKEKNLADKEWAKAWELRVAAELATAQAAHQHEGAECQQAQAATLAAFREIAERLRLAGLTPPTEPSLPAIAAAEDQLAARRQDATATVAYLTAQLAELDANRQTLIDTHLSKAQVWVASRMALEDPVIAGKRFGQIVIHKAEQLSRSEWDKLTMATDQLVAVGDWPTRPQTTSAAPAGHAANNGHADWLSPATKLWLAEYRSHWFREGSRLICQFAATTGDRIAEPLLDRPEIELRFGTTAAGEYVLAEVAFPATMPAEVARLLAVEIGDTPIPAIGPTRWHDDKLTVCWPMLDGLSGEWIDLEPGIREQIVAIEGVPTTAAISFDERWTRETAQAWLAEHYLVPTTGRTLVLAN